MITIIINIDFLIIVIACSYYYCVRRPDAAVTVALNCCSPLYLPPLLPSISLSSFHRRHSSARVGRLDIR